MYCKWGSATVNKTIALCWTQSSTAEIDPTHWVAPHLFPHCQLWSKIQALKGWPRPLWFRCDPVALQSTMAEDTTENPHPPTAWASLSLACLAEWSCFQVTFRESGNWLFRGLVMSGTWKSSAIGLRITLPNFIFLRLTILADDLVL